MSEISKVKDEDEELTVSKLYEILKSGPFLRNLYWDILSELNEKPTFQLMRETITKIINKKLDTLETLFDCESNSGREKTIVAEICSMAYAVDTVYSKILYIKLEKEFSLHILNDIRDLRNEGKIPDDVWAKLQMSSDSQIEGSDENTKGINDSAKKKAETPLMSTSVPVKKRKRKISCNEDSKKLENHKSVTRNNAKNEKKLHEKMDSRNQVVSKKIAYVTPTTSTPKKNLSEENNVSTKQNINGKNTDTEIDVLNAFPDENQDSDAESLISVGHVSLTSVSSVHTSDLSSYDDDISLSEDEEGTKKRLSLKELIARNSKLSSRIAKKLNGTKLRTSPKSSKKIPKTYGAPASSEVKKSPEKENPLKSLEVKKIPKTYGAPASSEVKNIPKTYGAPASSEVKKIPKTYGAPASSEVKTIPKTYGAPASSEVKASAKAARKSFESALNESPTCNAFSKRIRKPNSKYSSANIVCHSVKVKERKKQPDTTTQNAGEKNSSEFSPKTKRAKAEISDTEVETPNKIQKMDTAKENTASDDRSPKQHESSDLHKPHSSVRSMTSRRTAPVTLYSTAAQN